MFACLECGRKFRTAKSAEKASLNGCPKCGGVDIDIDVGGATPKDRYALAGGRPGLLWRETKDGDWEAKGFVAIRRHIGNHYALYRIGADGDFVGYPYRVGTLAECQARAEELREKVVVS